MLTSLDTFKLNFEACLTFQTILYFHNYKTEKKRIGKTHLPGFTPL